MHIRNSKFHRLMFHASNMSSIRISISAYYMALVAAQNTALFHCDAWVLFSWAIGSVIISQYHLLVSFTFQMILIQLSEQNRKHIVKYRALGKKIFVSLLIWHNNE